VSPSRCARPQAECAVRRGVGGPEGPVDRHRADRIDGHQERPPLRAGRAKVRCAQEGAGRGPAAPERGEDWGTAPEGRRRPDRLTGRPPRGSAWLAALDKGGQSRTAGRARRPDVVPMASGRIAPCWGEGVLGAQGPAGAPAQPAPPKQRPTSVGPGIGACEAQAHRPQETPGIGWSRCR
jgi:hypothetical protein